MILRFKTRAFMDKEQDCVLISYAPFRMLLCTAGEVFVPILQGELKAPFVLEGENGDAAIGGIFKPDGKVRDTLFEQAIRIIENNRKNGLRTGIIPVLAANTRPERGALLILVAHAPESEHCIEQESYTDYEKILKKFFDGEPSIYL